MNLRGTGRYWHIFYMYLPSFERYQMAQEALRGLKGVILSQNEVILSNNITFSLSFLRYETPVR